MQVQNRSSKPIAIALIVSMASFLQALDTSIIGTALPKMGQSFGVEPVDVGVGIVAYVLAASILIPAAPWIADRLEPKRVFLTAILGFVTTSLLCATSDTLGSFVTARFCQGVAAALMSAVGQIILVRSVERSSLLRFVNISTVPMLVAPVLGPPLGGFLAQSLGWQWVFYINLPIGLVVAAMGWRLLEALPVEKRPFDGIGFLLNAGTLTLLILGLERIAGSGPFTESILLLGAGIGLGALAIRHMRRHNHPIVSLRPFEFQTFRLTVVGALPLVRIPIGAFLFVVPIQMQVAFGSTAIISGFVLLAHAAGDLSMKPFMTATFKRFGYRRVLLVSTLLTAIGFGTFGLFKATTPLATIMIVAFCTGVARSFMMTGLNTLSYDEIPQPLISSAVTLSQIMIQVTTALAVSLAALLFEVSHHFGGNLDNMITARDCSNTLFAFAGVGVLSLLVLIRLPKNAGDYLSGRASAKVVPPEEGAVEGGQA